MNKKSIKTTTIGVEYLKKVATVEDEQKIKKNNYYWDGIVEKTNNYN